MKASTLALISDKLQTGKYVNISENYTLNAYVKDGYVYINIYNRSSGEVFDTVSGINYDSAVITAIYWIRRFVDSFFATSFYRKMRVINLAVRGDEYDFGSCV
jgi:hypothetical protein